MSEVTKKRKITLHKQAVHFDIDALTYKLTESTMQALDQKAKNAVASDRGDAFDASVLARLTDYRDATLRKKLLFCLAEEEMESFDNKPEASASYEYNLVLPGEFKDVSLKIIGTKMHEYLVKGGLLDWYIQTGVMSNTTSLSEQVAALESEIVSMLRVPNNLKRPLQPFGPSK
jgi:hypothetical protein